MKRTGCGGVLLTWLITSAAVAMTAWLLPGVELRGAGSAMVLALVLGLLNAVVRPVLVLLTLPVTLLTLGLFLLVVNAVVVLLADRLVPGFSVDGFWWALGFSLVLSVVSAVLEKVIGPDDEKRA